MPFGETLTLLATLANAYQALRYGRQSDATADTAPAIDPALFIALDAWKAANEETIKRLDAASNRSHLVIALSAVTLLLSAFLGASVSDPPAASSPLFIASVVLFVVITLAAIASHHLFAARPLPEADGAWGGSQDDVEKLLKQRQSVERENGRRLTLIGLGTDGLLLIAALQVVLAAVWLIE